MSCLSQRRCIQRLDELMPTNAEIRRRRNQSKKDKAKHRYHANLNIDRTRATYCKASQQALDHTKSIDLAISPMMEPPNTNFVSKMFNKEEYSDVTVMIHGMKLYAHRFVICVQSRYFAKAFQDNTFKEGNTGEIMFEEDSAMAHWRVFEYLYTGDYSDTLNTEELKDDPALLKDPRVYYLAEKFLLKDLKELALSKLKKRLKKDWESKTFSDCIEEIYTITSSSSSMRLAVAQIAAEHGKDLQKEETFLDLLHSGGEFVVDFYKALRIW